MKILIVFGTALGIAAGGALAQTTDQTKDQQRRDAMQQRHLAEQQHHQGERMGMPGDAGKGRVLQMTARQLAENPELFIGEKVSVVANVDEIRDGRIVVLNEGRFFATSEVLAVAHGDLQGVERGETVRVVGIVKRMDAATMSAQMGTNGIGTNGRHGTNGTTDRTGVTPGEHAGQPDRGLTGQTDRDRDRRQTGQTDREPQRSQVASDQRIVIVATEVITSTGRNVLSTNGFDSEGMGTDGVRRVDPGSAATRGATGYDRAIPEPTKTPNQTPNQ
jgi:hypothetical protein